MARSSMVPFFCVVAALCVALRCSLAFLPGRAAPMLRGDAAMASAAVAASIPGAADAFVYDGKEYFDVWFGIPPLAWGVAAASLVGFGAILKNAAQKYNKPMGKVPIYTSGFVGKEIENDMPSYK